MNFPTMFKRDLATDLVVPQLHEDAGWLMTRPPVGTILIAAIPDGITVDISRISGTLTMRAWDEAKQQFKFLMRTDEANKPLFEAFDRMKPEPGVYIVFGPGINGNPHGAPFPKMIRIDPVDNSLVHYGISHGVQLPYIGNTTVEETFNSAKKALAEGDAPGFMVIWEHPHMKTKEAVKLYRKDFGLQWPVASTAKPSTASFGYCNKCKDPETTVRVNNVPWCKPCYDVHTKPVVESMH